jgi:hypothetical protein
MSDAAPSAPDELLARRTANSLAWTRPESWNGDEYIGEGLPPWGTKVRCPVIRNGRRCRKAVIPGGAVCNTHGGAAPQVRRRAKLRLLSLVDPALGQLARILANPDDQRVALAAIKLVTDLNGMGVKSDTDASTAKAVLMDRYFANREAERKELEEAAAELDLEADPNVIDAEEVLDDSPVVPSERVPDPNRSIVTRVSVPTAVPSTVPIKEPRSDAP